MNRRSTVAALALLASLVVPLALRAQVVAPTPDPLLYDDPAMHYVAPPGAVLIGGQMLHPTIAMLSQDPSVIARWVLGDPPNQKIISIDMELFSGSLDGFDGTFENALRGDDPSTLVKKHEPALLQNGMPVEFLDVTQGSGFQTHKLYAYIWIDGQRGVVLSVEAGLGVLDTERAKQLIAGASAVRYPSDQP